MRDPVNFSQYREALEQVTKSYAQYSAAYKDSKAGYEKIDPLRDEFHSTIKLLLAKIKDTGDLE